MARSYGAGGDLAGRLVLLLMAFGLVYMLMRMWGVRPVETAKRLRERLREI